MDQVNRGSCLCGSVNYVFSGDVADYGYCHCTMCRKASGSAHSANAPVDANTFRLEDPHKYIREYVSSPGTHRFFCSKCGTPLFTRIDSAPEYVRIRLGTLDTYFDKKTSRHTFVKDKAPWHDIAGDLPQFQEKFATN